MLVWSLQVPCYVSGLGIVLPGTSDVYSGGSKLARNGEEEVAVVFLPADQAGKLQPGLSTRLHLGTTGLQVETALSAVEPGIVSPYTICKNDDLLQYPQTDLNDGKKLTPAPAPFGSGDATQTLPRMASGFTAGTTCAALPDQPSIMAFIALSKSVSMTLRAGSIVLADVMLSRQRLFQLLLVSVPSIESSKKIDSSRPYRGKVYTQNHKKSSENVPGQNSVVGA